MMPCRSGEVAAFQFAPATCGDVRQNHRMMAGETTELRHCLPGPSRPIERNHSFHFQAGRETVWSNAPGAARDAEDRLCRAPKSNRRPARPSASHCCGIRAKGFKLDQKAVEVIEVTDRPLAVLHAGDGLVEAADPFETASRRQQRRPKAEGFSVDQRFKPASLEQRAPQYFVSTCALHPEGGKAQRNLLAPPP